MTCAAQRPRDSHAFRFFSEKRQQLGWAAALKQHQSGFTAQSWRVAGTDGQQGAKETQEEGFCVWVPSSQPFLWTCLPGLELWLTAPEGTRLLMLPPSAPVWWEVKEETSGGAASVWPSRARMPHSDSNCLSNVYYRVFRRISDITYVTISEKRPRKDKLGIY